MDHSPDGNDLRSQTLLTCPHCRGDFLINEAGDGSVSVEVVGAPMPLPVSRPTEDDLKRWAEADAEDERNGWGDAVRRIRTAFSTR